MEKVKLDSSYYHEAIDRTHLIRCMIDDYLYSHPALLQHHKLQRKLDKVSSLLGEVYQKLGQKEFETFQEE